jgi:hypothetical protein
MASGVNGILAEFGASDLIEHSDNYNPSTDA